MITKIATTPVSRTLNFERRKATLNAPPGAGARARFVMACRRNGVSAKRRGKLDRSRVGVRQDFRAKVQVALSQRERCRAATDRENLWVRNHLDPGFYRHFYLTVQGRGKSGQNQSFLYAENGTKIFVPYLEDGMIYVFSGRLLSSIRDLTN